MSHDDLRPLSPSTAKRIENFSSIVRERLTSLNAVVLPAKVLYRNDALLPDSIKDIVPKEGAKMDFPFLIESKYTDESTGFRFATRRSHDRSAYLGECSVNDEYGHYFYMDVKGVGHSKVSPGTGEKDSLQWSNEIGSANAVGVLYHGLANNDLDYSETFARAGIGGHRVVAIFEYEKLPIQDKKRNIALLDTKNLLRLRRKEGNHTLSDRAVGAIRVFSEVRVNVVKYGELKPIFQRLNRRFGCNLRTGNDYGFWLAQRLGENLAIMHKLGCTHKYLSSHNVLADGTFIDDDSVTGPEDYGTKGPRLEDDAQLLDDDAHPRTFRGRKESDYGTVERTLIALRNCLRSFQ